MPKASPPRAHGALALAPLPEPVSDTQLKVEQVTPDPPSVSSTTESAGPWRAILDRLRVSDPACATLFEHAVPMEISRDRIALGYAATDLLGSRATDDDALAALGRAAQAHFGAKVPIHVDVKHRGGKTGSVHAIDAAAKRAELVKARAAVENHPLVRDVVRVFDAELRDVKLPEDG